VSFGFKRGETLLQVVDANEQSGCERVPVNGKWQTIFAKFNGTAETSLVYFFSDESEKTLVVISVVKADEVSRSQLLGCL
jgi:hypothetical protein